jgi:DNA mismatch repair ATPase MutS
MLFIFCLLLLAPIAVLGRSDVQSILFEHHDLLQDSNHVAHGNIKSSFDLFKIYDDQLNISSRNKREVTLASIGIIDAQQELLDKTTMNELELVTGQVGSRMNALAEYIDRTKTDAGRYALRSYLLQPINSKTDLTNRRDALQEIISNKSLFVQLKALVTRVAAIENLLSANVLEDSIANSFEQTLPQLPWYIPFGTQFNEVSRSSTLLANINRVGWVLDSYLEANPISYASVALIGALATTVPQYFMFNQLFNPQGDKSYGYLSFLKNMAINQNFRDLRHEAIRSGLNLSLYMSSYKYPYFSYVLCSDSRMPEIVKNSALGIGAAWFCWRGYTTYTNVSLDATRIELIQQKIGAVARLVESLDEIKNLVQEYPFFKKTLACDELLSQVLCGYSDEYQSMLNKLRSNTFKGSSSYWSNQGRVTTAYALFKKYHNQLYKGLRVIAEVDVLQAAAQLLFESDAEHPWCLPRYDFDRVVPKLEIAGVWHPYLINGKPVLNNVQFGIDGAPQTMVVTGPNAGGKSTVMKSVGLAALLAQTKLGVAPATSMVITPFDSIVTYLNITDSLSEGESLFKASVKRAHEVVRNVQGLSQYQKGLVVLDEVFTGTTSKECSAAAYALVKTLGSMPNIITVAVTHFPIITKLENERPDLFANWKVTVNKLPDGRLIYPFILEKGIADQNIAFDVMRKEGYATDFMQEAEKALALID